MKLWTLIRAIVSKPGVQQDRRENTQRTKTNSARPPPAGNRQTVSRLAKPRDGFGREIIYWKPHPGNHSRWSSGLPHLPNLEWAVLDKEILEFDLPAFKKFPSFNLLYSTGGLCSMLCGSLDGKGVWGRMDTCMCMAESLHCSHETVTMMLTEYTLIENKKV